MSVSSVGPSAVSYIPNSTPAAPPAPPKGRDSDGDTDGSTAVASSSSQNARTLNIVT